MTRRILVLSLLATVMLAAAGPARAGEIKPHMLGWERILTLEYEPVAKGDKTAVEGSVTNISPYHIVGVRILIDSLDAGGQVTAQRVAWVPGELSGGGHLFFSVPAAAAPAYRVRVYSYDRVESIGDHR